MRKLRPQPSCGWLPIVAAVALAISPPAPLNAAVTTVGAVPNAPPPGGGAVVGPFTIGESDFGSVTVTGGTAINNSGGATVGNGASGIGVVSLSGFDSDWIVGINSSTGDLTIGDEGVGQVAVSSQARLTVPDDTVLGAAATASGKLTVAGLGSVYGTSDDLTVGVSGVGVIDVTTGGALQSDAAVIGDLAGSQGTVTISGDLSRWTAAQATVGDAGRGTLAVAAAGRVTTSSEILVGQTAGGVGSVDVSGEGTLVSSAGLIVGAGGSGRFVVRDGALYTSSANVAVATADASVGELVVSGPNARLHTLAAVTTSLGDANILVADGGVISATSGFIVNASGRVQMAGGRLETTQALNTAINVVGVIEGYGTLDAQGVTLSAAARMTVPEGGRLELKGLLVNNGLVDVSGGELHVRGVLNNNGDIDARNGAILRVGGTGLDINSTRQLSITGGQVDVYGAVDNNAGGTIAVVGGSTGVFHDAVTNSGTIFVSASSEIALLENLAFSASSALNIALGSASLAGQSVNTIGNVDVAGAATLSGALSVSLGGGFTPTPGATYELLHAAGGRTGSFSTETLPTLGGGLAFDVQYTPNAVVLAVVSSQAGDYDNDGDVDGFDFLAWQRGQSPNPLSAADLAAWKANFGATAAATIAAVPEPAAALVALPAVLALARATKQRAGSSRALRPRRS